MSNKSNRTIIQNHFKFTTWLFSLVLVPFSIACFFIVPVAALWAYTYFSGVQIVGSAYWVICVVIGVILSILSK